MADEQAAEGADDPGGEAVKRPLLIVVTGRPGSGKTTLAEKLAKKAHLPLVSRDAIKEGYVHTQGVPHAQLPDGNLAATDLFFRMVETLLDGGASLVAEAAFQHRLWSDRLKPLMKKARIYVVICRTEEDSIAFGRYIRRGMEDPMREYFHGDDGVAQARQGFSVELPAYDPPQLDVPTFWVDTTDGYMPEIETLLREICFP